MQVQNVLNNGALHHGAGSVMYDRRDVRSLRDLRQEHLPLLRNIRNKGIQASPPDLPCEELYLAAWQDFWGLKLFIRYGFYHKLSAVA